LTEDGCEGERIVSSGADDKGRPSPGGQCAFAVQRVERDIRRRRDWVSQVAIAYIADQPHDLNRCSLAVGLRPVERPTDWIVAVEKLLRERIVHDQPRLDVAGAEVSARTNKIFIASIT
jgi:hypothetical protein